MPSPDERETEEPDPHTQRNPGTASAERAVPAESQIRPGHASETPSFDTLLSAPAPAASEELRLDQRLSACETQLAEVSSRVDELERHRLRMPEERARSYWIWLVFLAGLALAWQILSFLR